MKLQSCPTLCGPVDCSPPGSFRLVRKIQHGKLDLHTGKKSPGNEGEKGREREKRGDTGNIKMTGLNPTILIITLNVNKINTD